MANTTGRKYGGRKKGTPNKDTIALHEQVQMFLEDQWERKYYDFDKLTPKQRVEMLIRLFDFALLKLRSVNIQQKEFKNPYLELTPEEQEKRLDELIANRNYFRNNHTPIFKPTKNNQKCII